MITSEMNLVTNRREDFTRGVIQGVNKFLRRVSPRNFNSLWTLRTSSKFTVTFQHSIQNSYTDFKIIVKTYYDN